MKSQREPNWDFVAEQIEQIASEVEYGELNFTVKVRSGKVSRIEQVETSKRAWIHLERIDGGNDVKDSEKDV